MGHHFLRADGELEAYLGIFIDHSRDARLTDQARDLLEGFYLRDGERYQHGYARACVAWSTYKGVCDYELAQRLYGYVSMGWFGFASPVLSNAPLPGQKANGMPISCFAAYVPDTL
ncbi:MAG: ribonucleotide-diphosphate reductase subunit alpha, partial [Hyphomicrobiales bacterium]|nr:ribonucleotide-diphosphate reductase subunit alpha [Hyphomicrobiales bacterium]